MPSSRPNVVLVVMDTARASAFEPWGAPSGSTPTVAQLASRGTAVKQALATCNWTLPSHAAMFTGKLPRAVGLVDVPGAGPASCKPVIEANRQRVLPEVLQRAGYRTCAASANVWIAEPHGFGTGFDTFVSVRGKRDPGIDKTDRKTRLRWMLQAALARVDDGASAAEAAVDEWLRGRTSQPFFWFFNLIECHSPYLPPRPWNDLKLRDRLEASREARRHLTLAEIWRANSTRTPMPDDTVERMRHLYDRSVSLMDAWLARILDRLDKHKMLDDTIVIVTSDHGENIGEDHLIGHAFSLDQRLLHVPLVAAGPDTIDLAPFMSTVDLPRIIGSAVGLAANPWARDVNPLPPGVAVAQYDGLVTADDPRLAELTREWQLDDEARRMFYAPMTAASDGHLKLVRHGDRFALFDLDADPTETSPLGADRAPAALQDALRASDAVDADPAAIAALVASAAPGTSDASMEEQLKLLGYL